MSSALARVDVWAFGRPFLERGEGGWAERGGGDVGIRKSDLRIDGEDWEGVEMEGWEDVDRLECLRWIEMGKMGTDSW